jgi:hypothetical protein
MMHDKSPDNQIARISAWVGIALGTLANIGGVLAIFGVSGSVKMGLYVFGGGTLVIGISLTAKHILSLHSKQRELQIKLDSLHSTKVVLTDISDIVVSRRLGSHIRDIYILASGTETYFSLLSRLFNEELLPHGITLHVGFRVGKDEVRHHKLLEYEKKWNILSNRHNLKIIYYPFDDYLFSMRGIVVDAEYGWIGFYHRINDVTYGAEEMVIFALRGDPVGQYLIDAFVRILESLKPFTSLSSALHYREETSS